MTKKILNKKQKIVISIVAAVLIIAIGISVYVVIIPRIGHRLRFWTELMSRASTSESEMR